MSNATNAPLREIERAAVRGWPALETGTIDGWLARASSGGSVRANSVSALDWTGTDLDGAIARVVGFYRQRDAVPRFTITEVDRPAGLDARLGEHGWHRRGDHVTMAKPVAGGTASPAGGAPASGDVRVIRSDHPTEDWLRIYLQGVSESRRAVAPRLVAGVPGPRAFFTCVRDGEAIGSGLSVADGPLASVQCMATAPATRRQGAARAVLAAIEAWAAGRGAEWLYLQADADNTPAVTLYERVGFAVAGRYHTRERAG
jgi:ribosomal protein S18 acetylase RimI-like enzyme